MNAEEKSWHFYMSGEKRNGLLVRAVAAGGIWGLSQLCYTLLTWLKESHHRVVSVLLFFFLFPFAAPGIQFVFLFFWLISNVRRFKLGHIAQLGQNLGPLYCWSDKKKPYSREVPLTFIFSLLQSIIHFISFSSGFINLCQHFVLFFSRSSSTVLIRLVKWRNRISTQLLSE